MDFEKHTFGFGVTTGLILSYLDIQLAHYLQSLIWPIWSLEMNEADFPALVKAVEALAEPNCAEWISAISVVIAALLALWQYKKNSDLDFNREAIKSLQSLYNDAFSSITDEKQLFPNNKSLNWNLSAEYILQAAAISRDLKKNHLVNSALLERKKWKIKFQKLLEFDQNNIKLDAQFFFGSPDFPNTKNLIQTKIETKDKGLNLDPSAIAVIFLFAYKPDYLSHFVKAKKKEIDDKGIWKVFDKEPFHTQEVWDKTFEDNKQIIIRETGAYEYIESLFINLFLITPETALKKGSIIFTLFNKDTELDISDVKPEDRIFHYIKVDSENIKNSKLNSQISPNERYILKREGTVTKLNPPYISIRYESSNEKQDIFMKSLETKYKVGDVVEFGVFFYDLINDKGMPIKENQFTFNNIDSIDTPEL